jgi:L-rhamnose mutarotase
MGRPLRTHVLLLDLRDDAGVVADYRSWHQPGRVPEAVLRSIRDSGILGLDIHLVGHRMAMVLTVTEWFTFERWAQRSSSDPAVRDWETLMWRFQQALPGSAPGAKWTPTERIFTLGEQTDWDTALSCGWL